MKTAEIRQAFLDYFASQGHQVVPSSSLVPHNDPTLLFTNAGMNQFKDVFLGREHRDYTRATSSQRCVRAGGKHNDLENVGYTARHHTFFEMLGNFSFGDYFKREAITYAWTFLTEVLALPPEKLWITVHISDDEAADIWLKELGVSPDRFSRLDEDNFWQMGDTGPCGPCSEIFYDHGEHIAGGPPGSADDELDRYIEIWNLVFMQFDRQVDGELKPLPKPSVDTGMGLERISAVMQNVHTNYDIDLFQHLLQAAAEVTGCTDLGNKSLRVLADHIRSSAFLISDGIIPGNEGRAYVLRRIIRRALRHGHQLGAKMDFFHRLVAPLVIEMGAVYPELAQQQTTIEQVLADEQVQFARTLDSGLKVLEAAIDNLSGKEIPGHVVFTLYDTHGFPVDLTNDIAREHGLVLDQAGFDTCMAEQKARSKGAGHFANDYSDRLQIDCVTDFTGHDTLADQVEVLALFRQGEEVASLSAGEEGAVLLASTPFYAESGGQVGDCGWLTAAGLRFQVTDTRKRQKAFLHLGCLEQGKLTKGTKLTATVDADRRAAIRRNHSATHLLHAALREQLGEHIHQKGSLVNEHYLRFDFSHPKALLADELAQLERRVNEQVLANTPVTTELMSIDKARASGAMALFGEKYDDQVRVLTMGESGYSRELCGGTHVHATGDIGLFSIDTESATASGVRRIEATTGFNALSQVQDNKALLHQLAIGLRSSTATLEQKMHQLVTKAREQDKEIERLQQKLASGSGSDLLDQVKNVNGIKLLVARLEGVESKALRKTLDKLKDKLGSGVILLASVNGDKISLVAGVTADLTDRVKAGDLLREVATAVGGKGGGRPDMAQGGGSDVAALSSSLEKVDSWLAQQTA